MRPRIYLCYCCNIQVIIQNHCTLKVKKVKFGSSSSYYKISYYHKTILGSNIYTKLLFVHALTGCDTTSSINGVGRATVFKKLLSNKHLKEAASVFSASSKSHEVTDTDHSLSFLCHKQRI